MHDPWVGLACLDTAAAGIAADEGSVSRHVKDIHRAIEDQQSGVKSIVTVNELLWVIFVPKSK